MSFEKIWYASYGSNLNRFRFLYYILGGKLEITGRNHIGCLDKSLPVKEATTKIPFELYFSKKSESWENKAVAFVKTHLNENANTLCKLYLVTKEQFIDIMMQENDKDPNEERFDIDFESVKQSGHCSIGKDNDNAWYGKLVYVKEQDNYPVFTFTAKREDETIEYSEPGNNYLKTIIAGINENFSLSEKEILDYLITKGGIKDNINSSELETIIKQPLLSKNKKFIVKKTNERFNSDGFFVAQLNPDKMRNKYIPGQVIIIKNKRMGEEFKVKALLQSNDEVGENEIRLDQKIRMAIGVQPNMEVEIEQLGLYDYIMQLSFMERLLGVQINILRVKFATFTDMEINICRISKRVMQTIGIEEGERIFVESVNGKIEIRALELTGQMEEVRRKTEEDGKSQFYPKNPLRKKLLVYGNKTSNDLPWIFLDNDARNKLKVKPYDPVIVYRSTKFAVLNKLHLVSIPLILSIIGFIFSYEKVLEKGIENGDITQGQIFYIKAGLFFLGLIIVFLLHLLTIRKKIK